MSGDATRVVSARLDAFGAAATRGLMRVRELSTGSRIRRSASGLGACWGAAALTALLPVLHLVLVPSLVGGGIIAAIVLGRQVALITELSGTCPRCHTEQMFEAGGSARRSIAVTCPACHTNVTVVALDGRPDPAPRA